MSTAQPSYGTVLRTRHVLRSFVPSILGRLSQATSGLAVVLLLKQSTGSFAIGGSVTAMLGVTSMLATPWRARLIDRRGQPVVLAVLSAAFAASLLAIGIARDAGPVVLLGLAALAGIARPPFATTMRVLFSDALPAGGLRTRGFSLDAVAGEITYAVGPLVTALLAAIVSPFASLLLSVGCVVLGAAFFVTSPLSRRQRGTRDTGSASPGSPLRGKGFPSVVIAMVAPGIILGGVDLAAPAIASAESSTFLSGLLLALFAGASGVSGLLFGLVKPRATLERQLVVLTFLLLAVTAVTGLVAGAAAAVIGFSISGLTLAPVLIVGYLAGDARAAPAVRTEANSWLDAAVQLGSSVGAAAVGALTDAVTPGHALAISAVGASLVAAFAVPGLVSRRA